MNETPVAKSQLKSQPFKENMSATSRIRSAT